MNPLSYLTRFLLTLSIVMLVPILSFAQQSTTLTPIADTYLRAGAPDTNEGNSTVLRVKAAGDNKALMSFEQYQINQAVGGGSLISATLRLHITENYDNWSASGRTIDVHRMLSSWSEGNGFVAEASTADRGSGSGATWKCASDSNITNHIEDCPEDEWEVSPSGNPNEKPWSVEPTDTKLITNGLTGAIDLDVTSDVQVFLSEQDTNFGWVVKKTDENLAGRIHIGSREGSLPAELILTYDGSGTDATPPIISISSPVDGLITADPNLTVNGSVNEPVSTVLVNGTAATANGSSFSAAITLQSGENSISVVATDLAGNTSTKNVTVTLGVVATVSASADTYLRRGASDTNEGSSNFLRVRAAGRNKALVAFDQNDIVQALNGATLLSASVRLSIIDNANNWSSTGRSVDLHRMLRFWEEGNGFVSENVPKDRGIGSGATWRCAVDSNITNRNKDCPTDAWEVATDADPSLKPWVEQSSSSVLITNGLTGSISFDVTADVQAFLAGQESNFGWVIKKTLEGKNGKIRISSREGVSPPELVLTYLSQQVDTTPPVIDISIPADGTIISQNSIEVSGTVDDATATVLVNGQAASFDGSAFSITGFALQEGDNTIVATATDPAGNVGQDAVTVTVDSIAPTVAIDSPLDGALVSSNSITVSGTVNESGTTVTVNGQSASVSGLGYSATVALVEGSNAIVAVASDLAGNAGQATVTVTLDTSIPPDPSVVAPEIDRTVSTVVGMSSAFLFEGPNPIQQGVAPGTIDVKRTSVIRGEVLDRLGNALTGVTVSIANHPELGQTGTRVDGLFDLAVNGGSRLTVEFRKDGYLTVHRSLEVRWQEFTWIEEPVVMTQRDAVVSAIDLTTGLPQVARGSVSTDIDGSRQATVLFPSTVTAELVMPDGSLQPISNLSVRATEYTVGPDGKNAMPADLPVASAYTYAVELGVDEAEALGAVEVRFSEPVPFYVENFLGFPVGEVVPSGYYSLQEEQWLASENGVVLGIVDTSGGVATIDYTGDGVADDPTAIGVTLEEQEQLAGLYSAGESLWRVAIPHFSSWDHNWPYIGPSNAKFPENPIGDIFDEGKGTNSCQVGGSTVDVQHQILGEEIPIAGTPFELVYRSDRVPGRVAGRTIDIELSGDTIPSTVTRIELRISIAGQYHRFSFLPGTNLRHTFTWDGKDGYGRLTQGSVNAQIRIGYVYKATYSSSRGTRRAFGNTAGGNNSIGANRDALEIILWQKYYKNLRHMDFRQAGIGGWSIDVVDFYDINDQSIYEGDGDFRKSAYQPLQASRVTDETVVQFPSNFFCDQFATDGAIASETCIDRPFGVAYAPDGTLYVSSLIERKIYKITTDGEIFHIAGKGEINAPNGNNGPAIDANFSDRLTDLAVGPDGSLYILDMGHYQIRRITPDGIITRYAGVADRLNGLNNSCPKEVDLSGDGGPAKLAKLGFANGTLESGLAFGPDGALYFTQALAVRKITPDGIISTVAGTGFNTQLGSCTVVENNDQGPARDVRLDCPAGLDFDAQGNLYFANCDGKVRKVDPSGNLTIHAGTLSDSSSFGRIVPLNVPAISEPLGRITDVMIGDQGELYVSKHRGIVVISSDGIINNHIETKWEVTRMARNPVAVNTANSAESMLFTAMHSFYDPDYTNNPKHRGFVAARRPMGPDFRNVAFSIASESGSLLHGFDNVGRHRKIQSTLTAGTLFDVRYDTAGHVSEIEDGDGNITTVEWSAVDPDATPVAVVGPYGHRTELRVNADGYLDKVTNPETEAYEFDYHSADGLLASFTRPNGQTSQFFYDSLGFLTRDENDVSGSMTLARSYPGTEKANWSVLMTTAESRQSTFQTEVEESGTILLSNTLQDGSVASASKDRDGVGQVTTAEGVEINYVLGSSPRFRFEAPLLSSYSEQNPSGLTSVLSESHDVEISDPLDPLSLTSLFETLTDNSRDYSYAYDPTTSTGTFTTPEGRAVTQTLDGQARPLSVLVPGFSPINFTYDLRGRLETVVSGSGAETRSDTYTYGTDGFVESITDTLGRNVQFERDGIGRITKQILPDLREILFSYDANGNLASLIPPGRPAHVFRYTAIDETREYESPAVPGIADPKTVYTYTPDKDLDTILRPDGKLLDFDYNSKHQLTSIAIPRGTLQFGYDTISGLLTSVNDPSGVSLTFAYDGDLLSSTTWSGVVSGSVSQTYNSSFLIDSMSVNGAHTVSYIYDQDDLLSSVGSLSVSVDSANGLLTGTTLGSVNHSMNYNGFGEPDTISYDFNGSGLYSTTYGYDTIGRIVTKAETIEGISTTYEYVYDTAGRLDQVKENSVIVRDYDYDSNSNRTHLNGVLLGAYDAQDRLTSYDGATYGYNDAGDLLSKADLSGVTNYNYDVFGNLLTVSLPTGDSVEYLVDGRERRVGKKVNGVLQYQLLYGDQLNPVAELDTAGNVVSRFVYGTRINVPDYIEKGGLTYRVIADHLGSVRLVVDVATGQIAQRIDYDEFGQVLQDTNPGFQPFGFAGGLWDAQTGVVRFGARDYDPRIGRWTSKDPILFDGGGYESLRVFVG